MSGKLSINKESLQAGKDALSGAWQRAFDKGVYPPILSGYQELMRCGFLGTLDFYISMITEDGELDLDEARRLRETDPAFNDRVFAEAENQLVEHWPNLDSLLERVG